MVEPSTNATRVLRFLGVDGPTGRPLPPLSVEQAWGHVAKLERRFRLPRHGVEQGRLAETGWGLVCVEGKEKEVKKALAPLLELRRRQAGPLYQELSYRPGESSRDFRARLRSPYGRVDPLQVPWYLLLVGAPHEIPHGFEHDLVVPHAIGRLAFDPEHAGSHLAAYALRVAAYEDGAKPAWRPPRVGLFAPNHVDDPPTRATVDYLGKPLRSWLGERLGSPATSSATSSAKSVTPSTLDARLGSEATRAGLLAMLDAEPDLLLTAGHAVTYSSGHPCQRERMGALVCADWTGEEAGGIGPEHSVAAVDLQPDVLRGGVALLYGCHTVGIPKLDPFDDTRVSEAKILSGEAFASALGQRLLGASGGALGVIGHVGRAFEASVVVGGVSQRTTFEDVAAALLDGHRLGQAMVAFGQRAADLATTWTSMLYGPDWVPQEIADQARLELWVALHDSRSWSLLGDPAVRLPIATVPPPTSSPRHESQRHPQRRFR